MNTATETYQTTLNQVCENDIAGNAAAVDHNGAFPTESIAALKSAGLLGAISSVESGGLGLGLAGAARIVRRVAEECGSTAMVLTMHYCGAAGAGSARARRSAARGRIRRPLEHARVQRSRVAQPLLVPRRAPPKRATETIILNAAKSWVTSASQRDGLRVVVQAPVGGGREHALAGPGRRQRSRNPRPVRRARPARQRFLPGACRPMSPSSLPPCWARDGQGFEIMMGDRAAGRSPS